VTDEKRQYRSVGELDMWRRRRRRRRQIK